MYAIYDIYVTCDTCMLCMTDTHISQNPNFFFFLSLSLARLEILTQVHTLTACKLRTGLWNQRGEKFSLSSIIYQPIS